MANGNDTNKKLERYFRAIERDSGFVQQAIEKGARLSLTEWHDFIFKADVACMGVKSIAKYATIYPAHRGMALVEAMLFGCICSVQLTGYTYKKATRLLKAVVKKFNKISKPSSRLYFSKSDEDGTTYFCVESGRSNTFVESPITDRESLCEFLLEVWELMVKESFLYNSETRAFVEDHLSCEISLLQNGQRPSPYFGSMKSNTLEVILMERTDYGKPASEKKPVIKLCPTGTETAKPK